MRWIVAAGVSAVAWIAALAVVASTEVGPVLAHLTQHHGIHLGDVVVLSLAAVVSVAAFGLALAGRTRRHRTLVPEPARR